MLCVTAGTEVGGERHGVIRRRGRPVRETRLPGRTRGGKPKLYIQKSRGGVFWIPDKYMYFVVDLGT